MESKSLMVVLPPLLDGPQVKVKFILRGGNSVFSCSPGQYAPQAEGVVTRTLTKLDEGQEGNVSPRRVSLTAGKEVLYHHRLASASDRKSWTFFSPPCFEIGLCVMVMMIL